jgi:hypothetical protein
MSEIIKVIECVYGEDEVNGYILTEDFASLIPFDTDKWHKMVVYTHADYCPVRKNVLLRVAHKVLELMPFYTGTWPCECFDDTFRPDTEYNVRRGYVEIEFENDELSMSYLIRKSEILTRVWENPNKSGEWVCSSPNGELRTVSKPIIKGINVDSPTDENGDTIYLMKHHW